MKRGTRTAWSAWEGDAPIDDVESAHTYVTDQTALIDDVEGLMTALRTDGVARTFTEAAILAEQAIKVPFTYGYVDESPVPEQCDDEGLTRDGEKVLERIPAVAALIM